MEIDRNWTFRDLVINLKMLKREYSFRLAFFSYYYEDRKEEIKFKKKLRDSFYALDIKEDLIDRCWEYMNGYYPYYPLIRRIQRMDKRNKK